MSETSCFSSSLRQCSSETLRSISGKVAGENDCEIEFFCFNADLKFEKVVYGVTDHVPSDTHEHHNVEFELLL